MEVRDRICVIVFIEVDVYSYLWAFAVCFEKKKAKTSCFEDPRIHVSENLETGRQVSWSWNKKSGPAHYEAYHSWAVRVHPPRESPPPPPSFLLSLSLSLAAVIPCVRDGETSTRRRRARRRQRPRPRPRRGRPRRRRGGGSAAAQGCEVGWCGGGGVAVRVQSSCPQLQRPPLPHPVTRSFPFFFLFSLATNYVLYCLAPLVGSPNQ
jgi:hypothetical protein